MKDFAKRGILLLFSFIMIFQLVAISPAYALDSNDYRKQFINIKKGQNASEVDINSISVEDLRMIGLFLSNFYIPFGTVFDEEDETGTLDAMTATLVDVCGLDESMAKPIATACFKASLNTCKPLYFKMPYGYKGGKLCDSDNAASTGNSKMIIKAFDGKDAYGPGQTGRSKQKGAWFQQYACTRQTKITSVGDWDLPFDIPTGMHNQDNLPTGCTEYAPTDSIKSLFYTPDLENKTKDGIARMTYGVFLSFARNGAHVKCFWDDTKEPKYDASRVAFSTYPVACDAFALANNGVKAKKGYGGNMFSLSEKEFGALNEDEQYKTLMPLAQLYVDWVGNIIVDDGERRMVILPACSNPYTFSKIGDDAGKLLNLINTWGVRNVQDGTIAVDAGKTTKIGVSVTNTLFDVDNYTGMYGDSALLDTDKYSGVLFWRKQNEDSARTESGLDQLFWFTKSGKFKFPNLSTRLNKDDKTKLDNNYDAFTDYVFIDTIGEYEYKDGNDSSIHTSSLSNPDGEVSAQYVVSFDSVSKGDILKVDKSDEATLTLIYLTYMFAYSNSLSDAVEFNKETHIVDMKFNKDAFPSDFDNNIDWSDVEAALEEEAKDQKSSEVLSMIYYILHPAKGFRYVSVWAKQKISAVLLGWHEDMVGASASNSTTGMTTYIGFSGYTTMPALEDMSWTNWLLENYNSLIVYLIIIISVILCCYIIIGSLTFQRAILGMLMFAVLAFVPPVAINASVNVVNQTCDAIYGSKFVYWALVQHQSFYQELYAALNNENDSEAESDYARLVLGQQISYANSDKVSESAIEQTDNYYASVKLKWMSPKKDNYLAGIVKDINDTQQQQQENIEAEKKDTDSEDDEDSDSDSDTETVAVGGQTPENVLTNFGLGMFKKVASGEEFLDEPDALYLYRDYMNISLYATKSYNLYSTYFGGNASGKNTADIASGDYRLQVGSHWTGSDSNKVLTYSSGIPLQSMIFANYEDDNGSYPSEKQFREVSSVSAIRKGFMLNTLAHKYEDTDTKMDYYNENTLAINYLLNFTKPYADIESAYRNLQDDIKNKNVKIDKEYLRGYGLPQHYFNFTHTDFSTSNAEDYANKDKLDYFYYGMYSESPFYFFNYNIYDQMKALTGYTYNKDSGSSENFKDLLLGNNLEYFYNYSKNSGDGYGELRDFMNMHDLFYYVIPLMKKGVDLVELYDSAYGMPLYDDIKVTFTPDGYVQVIKGGEKVIVNDVCSPDGTVLPDADKGGGKPFKELTEEWTQEEVYKFWHNYNVITIFNAYCTWVDTMYDCKYAKPETIHIGGSKKVVSDPLDPTSYYATPVYKTDASGKVVKDEYGKDIIASYDYNGRPMVFSRSEQNYYGLAWNDLTLVEKKIINVQESVYEKSIDLMNYYNFDDNVLATAFAMTQLFEFNKEFSQNSFIGKSYVMYPQSYELKAFTYDAYLRLIIANTTGDDLQVENNESLYERTMKNSSITFGILLIILDILCVYAIPAFKVFFIVILFLMSIVMIVASAVKIELNILSVTWKSLIRPLASFCAVSIGLAGVVALFLSNGAKGVTGEMSPTIQLGDPTMVTLVMIFVNAFALFLYWKIAKQVTQDFVKYAKAVANNIGGTVLGALKTVGGIALAGTAINALRDRDASSIRGSGAGERGSRNGKPEPIATGGGTGGVSGSGGGSVSGGEGTLDGNGSKTRGGHGQDPLSGKPENEKDSGNSTNSYESKAEAGRQKREGDSGTGAAVAAGVGATAGAAAMANKTDGAKKMSAREKSEVYKTRAREQRGAIDSIDNAGTDIYGNNVGTGGKLASARLKISERKNKALGSMYAKQADTYDSIRATGNKARDSVKKGASSMKRSASDRVGSVKSSVKKSDAYKNVRSVGVRAQNARREYSAVVRGTNVSTQGDVNNIRRARTEPIKKGARAVGNGAKATGRGVSKLAKGAGKATAKVATGGKSSN